MTGFAGLIALSMFGLGALLQASSDALWLLKWVGGAYLVWLGMQLWRAPALQLASTEQRDAPSGATLFRQGLLSAISNPKVLLFFGAFLPQFIDLQRPLLLQFAVMAATFAAIEFAVEYLLGSLATTSAPGSAEAGNTSTAAAARASPSSAPRCR